MVTLAVALAAGIGAVARYVFDQIVEHKTSGTFPLGTLLVNVTGSLLLGVVVGLGLHHGLPTTPSVVVGVGFAGGYTTFSTWAWESIALHEDGAPGQAIVNALGSFATGLVAAAAGLGLALL
ncbi:MAG TPA: fluoride efflux transporter CrcB [Mycobacteriales bacterium]|jgi:CrcB protein|nr:fluoride efflux transporter CrcB [Mycobacteriales bacterium]